MANKTATTEGVPVSAFHPIPLTSVTPEVIASLRAPIPASDILTIPRTNIRYTTDKTIQERLDAAVGPFGWEDHYHEVVYPAPIEYRDKSGNIYKTQYGDMFCELTILGTTHSAVAPTLIKPGMYGSPGENAQATALKRAAMKFGPGRELWFGTEEAPDVGARAGTDDYVAPITTTNRSNGTAARAVPSTKTNQTGGSGAGGASPAQKNFMTQWLGVPEGIVNSTLLTGGKWNPDDPKQDPNVGRATRFISYLSDIRKDQNVGGQDAYDADPDTHILAALKEVKLFSALSKYVQVQDEAIEYESDSDPE